MPAEKPFIVGFGGTLRSSSSGEYALKCVLREIERGGCTTRLFTGRQLAEFPYYSPDLCERTPQQLDFVNAIHDADGIVIATPGYHGGVSGLIKNAIDFLEDLREGDRTYLDGRAVGLIVTVGGWQSGGVTLAGLRGIVHSLRGWPTPLGITLNTSNGRLFDEEGRCLDLKIDQMLTELANQLVRFSVKFA